MRKQIFKLAAVSVALSAMSVSGVAFAQDAEEEKASSFDVVGGVAVVSDYRFRGVSLNNEDFAFQPTLTIKHDSGLYLGVWGSNIAANPGDDLEVDVFGGFSGGDVVTYDIGATYYLYPGVSAFNYIELTGKLGTTIGPATVGAQLSYAPSQGGTGNTDNIYLGTNAAVGIPNTPLTLTGSVGYEDGAFSYGGDKVDWSVGLTASKYGFTAGVSYVDSNRFVGGLGDAGVVFSLSYGF